MIYMYTSKNQSFWNTLHFFCSLSLPQADAPRRDRQAEAPPWEIDNSLELVNRPYLRLHVFLCLRQSSYVGSDEGTPWSRGGFQAIPYSGLFASPARGLGRPVVGYVGHFLEALRI